jgi:hypothetical protein
MKLLLGLLICGATSFCITNSYDSYMTTINKVTTLIQNISQGITHEMINQQTTRSSQPFSSAEYSKRLIEEIKKEIALITHNKNSEQISQEDKDVVEMLETYVKQLEMCASLC